MNKDNIFNFSCGVQYNNKLYISSVADNKLFEYNLSTNEIKFVMVFDEKREYLYRCAICYKNYAWFIPQNANKIAIVDLITLKVDYIPLKYKWIEETSVLRCSSAGIYDDKYLYIIPYDIDSLIIINLETREEKVWNNFANTDEKYIDAFYIDGHLYITPWTADKIIDFDVRTGEKKQIKCDCGKKQYSMTYFDEKNRIIWFAPSTSNKILAYDIVNNISHEYDYNSPQKADGDSYFAVENIKRVGNKIFMLPFNSRQVISIDANDFNVEYYPYDCADCNPPYFKTLDGESLYCVIESSDYIIFYNEEKNQFEHKNMIYVKDNIALQNIIVENAKNKNLIKEDVHINLKNYLELI